MAQIDNDLVKKAHTKVRYTAEMADELKKCIHPITGPMYFMENFMYIQHPTKGKVKFIPFDYQRDLCQVYNENRYSIAMIGRQLGKTTLAAGYLLWFAMFKPDSTILIAAHKREGASEIMQKIRYCYEELPDHIRAGVAEYNKQSLTFDNGSRILSQATTVNTGRGLGLSLVYLDEFAFVPPQIAKEFWTSLSPTLSTGGKCIITSTPNVDDDQFAQIWFESQRTIDEFGNHSDVGVNGFKGYHATWEAHPERDEEWARLEQAKVGEDQFKREHECEFISFNETLIKSMTLSQLGFDAINPIEKKGQVRWYEKLRDGRSYCVALDPSMGTGGDDAAIQVLELPTLKQVAEWQHNKSTVEVQIKVLRSILMEIAHRAPKADIYWTVENNTLGEACLVVIRDTGEERFPGTFMHDPNRHLGPKKRKGYNTTHRTKLEACAKFKSLVESDKMKLNSKNLVHELKYFIAKGNGYEASVGEKDDLIDAMLLIIRMVQHISQWDDDLQNQMSGDIGGRFEEEPDHPLPMLVL
jgi:hypothetical protein